MCFVFDQIDAIEKERAEKDQTLQRIRAWRESKKPKDPNQEPVGPSSDFSDVGSTEMEKNGGFGGVGGGLMSKKVVLVHHWPEWIELMERLVQQNYFDHKRKDEDKLIEDLGFNVAEVAEDEGFDFTRDLKTVQTAFLNFGKDRFDILRSLSRQDLQILVGYGCPSADKKVVFSAKLLRKHFHLDEGDDIFEESFEALVFLRTKIGINEQEGNGMWKSNVNVLVLLVLSQILCSSSTTPPNSQSTPTGNLDELVMRLIPALTDHIVPVIIERVCELVSLPSHQPNTDMAPTVPTSSTAANIDEVHALGSDDDRNSPA